MNLQPNIGGFIDGTFGAGGGSLGNFGLTASASGFNTNFSTSLGRIWSAMDRNQAAALTAGQSARNNLNARMGTEAPNALGLPGLSSTSQVTSAWLTTPNQVPQATEGSVYQDKVYGTTANVDAVSQLSSAQERGYDIWAQVHGARANTGDASSTLWVGYAGAHKFITPDLLIGGMAQIDWSDESNDVAGSSAGGTGWMIGPYMAAKLSDQNLFFNARVAYGQSSNDIDMTASTGSFDTERWLASAKVSGLFEHGNWDIRPAVSVSYFNEKQKSYTDSTATLIASQTFTLGEVRFGPTFSYDVLQDDGTTIRPRFGINGVWNFSVDNGVASQGAVLGSGDVRARLDAGVTLINTQSWAFDISGFYDGLGINDYDAYGGKARVTIPLH